MYRNCDALTSENPQCIEYIPYSNQLHIFCSAFRLVSNTKTCCHLQKVWTMFHPLQCVCGELHRKVCVTV